MNPLAQAMETVVRDLGSATASFALVGGLAVSARTEPRFTRDIDLAVVEPRGGEVDDVPRHMARLGWRVQSMVESNPGSHLATVRLASGVEAPDVVVDLLFASSGIEPEIVAAAEPVGVFQGLWLPVATVPHLLALKILSADEQDRPMDRVDALALLEVMEDGHVDLVRAALDLITKRGFNRGRDLQGRLGALLGR